MCCQKGKIIMIIAQEGPIKKFCLPYPSIKNDTIDKEKMLPRNIKSLLGRTIS